jgi:dienelactone hydrolase
MSKVGDWSVEKGEWEMIGLKSMSLLLLVVSVAFAQVEEGQEISHFEVTQYRTVDGKIAEIKKPSDWWKRRMEVLANMQKVMGEMPSRKDLEPVRYEVLSEESLAGGLVRRKLRYASDGESEINAFLFLPKASREKPCPAMLCLHQTIPIGKEEPAGLGGSKNLHYGLELAERGFVVLAPDYPSFGEYPYDFGKHSEWKSGSLKAVWDNMRSIDLLQQLTEVDASRIGCIGHSLGGHNTIFTAVFDERIKVAVSSCGFTRFHKYYGGNLKGWTSPRYMPAIAERYSSDPNVVPFDFPELIAALAPRGFFSNSPLHDDNFDCEGVRETIASANFIYELLGQRDNLKVVYPDSAHDFPPEVREQAYRFIAERLR